MHGTFDPSGRTDKTISGYSALRFVAIPALLAVALVAMAMIHPDVSRWMTEAVQAEFAPVNLSPETAPTQLAQPAKEIRTVKAN